MGDIIQRPGKLPLADLVSISFDVNAELLIPSHIEDEYGLKNRCCQNRGFPAPSRGVNPAITLPVFANYPFASFPQIPDSQANLFPFEVQRRHFALDLVGGRGSAVALAWVRDRWQVTHKLSADSAEFALAVEALDTGQFVQNSALTLVSLWGALEALFSPSTSELKFRVSSLIAAYLEPPGNQRGDLQKDVAKLYDKRSAAAHGKPKHEPEELLSTFNLLRRVIMQIIDMQKVPSKNYLEGLLFGSLSNADG